MTRNLLETRTRELHKQVVSKAYQQVLFGDNATTAESGAVSDQYAFELHAQAYVPAEPTTTDSVISISARNSIGVWTTSIARNSSNVPAG